MKLEQVVALQASRALPGTVTPPGVFGIGKGELDLRRDLLVLPPRRLRARKTLAARHQDFRISPSETQSQTHEFLGRFLGQRVLWVRLSVWYFGRSGRI
jgi:hypothetical protein